MRLEKRRQHNRINEDAAIQQISCRCKKNGFMLRILLCDDDARMLDKIHSKVRETMDALGEKVSISKYTNADMIGTAALAAADLALLDVDLEKKDYNGVDLARRLRAAQPDCVIVFITNYLDYAPEGYEVQAFRYVLKRKLDEDLRPVLTGAVEQVYRHQKMIQVQLYGEIVSVPVRKILYLEVHQHRITIRMTGGQEGYSFNASLNDLEPKLAPLGFLRIHKSYLVNMHHLRKLQCREAVLDDGTVLRVSEKSYQDTKQKYLMWIGWE